MLENPNSGQIDQDLPNQVKAAADVTDAVAADLVEGLTVLHAGELMDGLALFAQADSV